MTTQVVRGASDDCLDGLAVVLAEPLGDREVIDLVSGAALAVVDQTEVLECADIDYHLEPTFDTPEEALADVLREQPSFGTVPDWGVAQADDGRWGVVSLGGCF